MPTLLKALPLLRPLDARNQRRYMQATTAILRSASVTVEGPPLWVAPSVYLDCKEPGILTLGFRCVLSENVVLLTHDFSLDRYTDRAGIAPPEMEYSTKAPIRIGAYAFIGIRAVVMPGVTVGTGAIVGAGSVVTADVADGTVVAGNPARVLGTAEDAWERHRARWTLAARRG